MKSRRAQEGMALVIALIMLGLMTVICLASFNMGRTGMDVIANMQRRNEVTIAANAALEQALSTKRMFQNPSAIFLTPCDGVANTVCYDLNNDTVSDITVTMTPAPSCKLSQPIPTSTLDLANAEDRGCIKGSPEQWAIEGIPPGDSLCANTMWELSAVARDTVTSAAITVVEGAAVRVSTNDISKNCP